MSKNNSNFKVILQAALDKVKSAANIKADLDRIASKLSKIKIQVVLDSGKIEEQLNV